MQCRALDNGTVWEGPGIGPPDVLGQVFQQEGNPDGGDKQGNPGGGAQRGIGHLVDDHTQRHTGQNRQHHGQQRMNAGRNGQHGHIAAHHDDIAVGKVQQHDDAVNHTVAQGNQGIDAAQLKAVDDLGEEKHKGFRPFHYNYFDIDRKNTPDHLSR